VTVVAYCENSMQYVPPDGFFGIQIVQRPIWTGAPRPGHDCGSLRRSPAPPLVGWGGDIPSAFPIPSTP